MNIFPKRSLNGSISQKLQLTGQIALGTVVDNSKTYILVDENGNEYPAVLVDEEVELTATTNDIRIGTIAVTGQGVVVGEKEIPSYHSSEGTKLVLNGDRFILPMPNYEYTKLQAIFCTDSVSALKVAINNKVYSVQSNVAEANITVNSVDGYVDFGIANETGKPCLIRYFSLKEIY